MRFAGSLAVINEVVGIQIWIQTAAQYLLPVKEWRS